MSVSICVRVVPHTNALFYFNKVDSVSEAFFQPYSSKKKRKSRTYLSGEGVFFPQCVNVEDRSSSINF